MVTSSKILTVTYGTFSCRLEGFDDPFTTLQKVAEYFRKLAAQDRYFGGVPQVPDTDMLMRIANESNPSGVDAELESGGIVLRQKTGDAAARPAADASPVAFDSRRNDPAEADADEAEADETDAAPEGIIGLFRSRRQVQPAPRVPVAPPAPRPAPGKKSVAETLAAIRKNVENAGSAIEITSDEPDEVDDEDDEAFVAEAPTPAPSFDEPVAEDDSEPAAADAPEAIEDAEDDTPPEVEAEVEVEVEMAEADEEPEGEKDDDAVMAAEIVAEVGKDGHRAVEADDQDDAEPETLETESGADAVALDDEDDMPAEVEAAIEDEEAAETEDAPVAAAADAHDDGDEDATEADAFDDAFFTGASDTAQAAPPRKSSLTVEQEEELARDLAAAMEAGQDDDSNPAEDAATQRRRERRARVDALRSGDGFAAGSEAIDRLMATTQTKMDRPEQQRRLRAIDQLKAAVAATEAEAHYRKKDEVDPEKAREAADLAAYRDDLRRAQDRGPQADRPAPARPTSGGGAPQRPAQPPLILVSEQRIDSPRPQPTRQDDEREVAESRGNLALKRAPMETAALEAAHAAASGEAEDAFEGIPADAFTESTNFADFAERVGASEMHDLLEAAAAYTSIVEAKPRFSRAQVMSKLARLESAEGFSKEAGLRAFGKLLREGKILRVQDGQFAISKSSRFSVATRDGE
jgi:hypothetical protein